jgi:hypothetical protein
VNPIQKAIGERLNALPAELATLREHATRSARYCSSIGTDDTLQLGHQPWVAPEAYAVLLFAPAKKAWVAAYKERSGHAIPAGYRDLLLAVNGCSVHDFTLYGLPPSLQGSAPRLDRSRVQPMDLVAANRDWAREYVTEPGQFHFGGRSWTDDENIGYFWSGGRAAVIRAVRKSGEVVGEWPDLSALLGDELREVERRSAEETPADWWR